MMGSEKAGSIKGALRLIHCAFVFNNNSFWIQILYSNRKDYSSLAYAKVTSLLNYYKDSNTTIVTW